MNFNESYSFASKGYNPQKTTGILGLKPGSGSSLLGFLHHLDLLPKLERSLLVAMKPTYCSK